MASKEKFIRDRRTVMRIDGNLVIAYNTDRPYPSQIEPTCRPKLRRMHLPVYESREFPYLCAAPASPDYSGAILGRLSQTIEHYPLVKTASRYSMEPTLSARWKSLEQALMGVALCLLKHSGQHGVPLEYKFPPPPHLQGYLGSYSSAHAARTAIQRSRDAFQPLIAHAAWAAILHRSQTFMALYNSGVDIADMCNKLDNSWMETLRFKGGVHRAWLHDLRMSDVCDFGIRRAGLVLRNPKEWIYSTKLTALIVSNVPIWIVWGEGSYNMRPSGWTPDMVTAFGLLQTEANDAVSWHTIPKVPISAPKPLLPLPAEQPRGSESKGVRFEESSTANIHVDVHEWIKKKEILIAHSMEHADHTKLTKWKHRQDAAKAFECPGERGAFVYEWDRDEKQYPVRTRVNRANVEQAWSMFADTQRWYNCVENVWELCHELDPSALPVEFNDEYDDILLEYEAQSEVALEGWWSKTTDELDTEDTDLTSNSFKPEDIVALNRRDTGGNTLDAFDLISIRFGFACPNGSKYESMAKPPLKLQKALRIIGDGFETPVYTMEGGAEASFIQYVMYLDAVGHPDVNLSEVPSALCDLYPENPSFLGHQQSTVVVQQAVYMDTTLYIIRHRTEDIGIDWVLAVKDPCTAVQCIRSRPVSLMELVREFIDAKTAFYTLRPLPDSAKVDEGRALQKSEIFTGNRTGLGVRPLGHVLDLTDYIAYEAVKMKLLEGKDKRIARAVVKRGGIISRLAAGLVDEYDVIDGPTWNPDGKCIRVSLTLNGKQREYFDDDITLEELATFVGLYSFKVPNVVAPTEHSWWPTFNKFEESGLNVGVWTPRCEQWFQSRTRGIMEGGCGPLPSSKWRNEMRCEMETKRLYKAARVLAARYLSEHCD